MADPRIENGHIDIANELGEALSKTYFSPAESKVLWTILRKTYGWHKKTDAISYSQFELSTGMDRRHLGPAIKRLISRKIITCSNAGERHISEYGLQKNYDLWEKSVTDSSNKLLPIPVTGKQINLLPIWETSVTDLGRPVTDLGNKSVTDLGNHKNKKQYTKAITKAKEDLPDWIDREMFKDFVEMRNKIKKPLTDRAINSIIKSLDKLRAEGNNPNDVLEQSIRNCWQDVYALKNGGTNEKNQRSILGKLPVRYNTPEEIDAARARARAAASSPGGPRSPNANQ
ncbi:MAG: replication protein [Candidatus Marinimicrobia bacterium]|nr:replication protein [Candidatus Neomarinimicrobiota bacterium]MDD5540744.1 replication protein [Candidatus Neomarinimicrobiota bacterium]